MEPRDKNGFPFIEDIYYLQGAAEYTYTLKPSMSFVREDQ